MRHKSGPEGSAEKTVEDIRRATRKRHATSPEVNDLRREASDLKEVVAELTLENRLLKKSMIGDRGSQE